MSHLADILLAAPEPWFCQFMWLVPVLVLHLETINV